MKNYRLTFVVLLANAGKQLAARAEFDRGEKVLAFRLFFVQIQFRITEQ